MPRGIRSAARSVLLMGLACAAVGCGGGSNSIGSEPAPSNLSYISPVTATVGVAFPPLSPTVTGSVSAYSVTPALPPGLSLDMTTGAVSGTPTVTAVQAPYVVTASNGSGSTSFTLMLAVNSATGSAIALSASSLTFANQLVSTTSAVQSVALINIGETPLSVTSITITGSAASAFTETSACANLPASGTCAISVTFSPAAVGAVSAALNIATNAAGNPVVELFGTGVLVAMSFNPVIISAGQSSTLTWSAPNATSCTASGAWSGTQATNGSTVVTPASTGYYTYGLSCAGSGGIGSAVLTAYGTTPSVMEPPNEVGYQAAFYVAPPNQIVGLQTSLTVPPLPPVPVQSGAALFLWPGLGPGTNSANFNPINDGVLQPVLSWGPSCAPVGQPTAFSSWWISGQYVNTFGSDPGYSGCYSGNSILINPGDLLLINMTLDSKTSIWLQTVTDSNTNQSVTFSINMQAQGQNWAYFAMEFWFDATIHTPVTFSDTTITFQAPDTQNWCSNSQGATNAYIFTPPTPQNSGTQCFISSLVLTKPQ